MRIALFSLLLLLTLQAAPAAAQPGCPALKAAAEPSGTVLVPGFEPVDDAPDPAPLAELGEDSHWLARFEAAADELHAALRSHDESRWRPMLGGKWLSDEDADDIASIIADPCGAFAAPLGAVNPARRILGWTLPPHYSEAERAEIAARREAEALVCWSAAGDARLRWPRTAVEADNSRGRPYACARISYSLDAPAPQWRAFIEGPVPAAS